MSSPVARLLFALLLTTSSLTAAGFRLGERTPVKPLELGPVANWYQELALVASGDRVLAACGSSWVERRH